MSEQPGPVEPTKLRASNADREAVAGVLNQAMADGRITVAELQARLDVVYAAKTVGELEPLTRDLPGHLSLAAPATVAGPLAASGTQPVARIGGTAQSTGAFAMLGTAERRGDWVVPQRFTAVSILGTVELDLTEASFAAREVTITVFALMGGVNVTVPEGLDVRVGGVGVAGSFDRYRGPRAALGSPVVHLKGLALLSGVNFKRPDGTFYT